MMKAKLLNSIILLMLFTFPLSAQVRFGIEGGMNLSHYLSGSSKFGAEQVGGMKAGFQLGATVDYEIGDHWMLISGLSWLQNRSTMKMTDHMVSYFPKTEIKMNNIVLPLKVGYAFHLADKVSLIPSVGAYASYGFSAGSCSLDVIYPLEESDGVRTESTTWKPQDGFFYQVSENNYGSLQAFRHWDYGAIAGIKAVIADHYTVGLNYTVGLKKVQKQNDLRNSTFQLSVGYRF